MSQLTTKTILTYPNWLVYKPIKERDDANKEQMYNKAENLMGELTRLMDNFDIGRDVTVDKEPHLSNSNSCIHNNTVNVLNLNNSTDKVFSLSHLQIKNNSFANEERTPNFHNYSYIPHDADQQKNSTNFVLKNLSANFNIDGDNELPDPEKANLSRSNANFGEELDIKRGNSQIDDEVFEDNILKILADDDNNEQQSY